MDHRRSRSGEYAVLGCLFSPGLGLLALGLLLPARGRHGNGFLVVLGVAGIVLGLLLVLVQAVLPKPPEPPEPPMGAPEG